MRVSDAQLSQYDDGVLAFRAEDKVRYRPQIDHLIQTLGRTVGEQSSLRISKVTQAGSWRKGTALKPSAGADLDIDLVIHLDVAEASKRDVASLHPMLLALLRKAYPTKAPGDFTPSRRTVGIEFRSSGLKADLVPVVPVPSPPGFVWQPEVGGTGAFLTSPLAQLEFIFACKRRDPRFERVVRLAKQWRTVAGLGDVLSSFAIELVTAHLLGAHGPAPNIEDGFLRLLAYVAQSGLRTPISFAGAIRQCPSLGSPVRIFDPTNNENNVASRIGEVERVRVVACASNAHAALVRAQTALRRDETVASWRQVLGPTFHVDGAV